MGTEINRRDFLKLAGSFALGPLLAASPFNQFNKAVSPEQPNMIVIIFDAMSAYHLSLYGYPRRTSPNFERFAERATVYHNHHSAANFTTSSTASLFTSTYPWQHHAITLTGMIRPAIRSFNIFNLMQEIYYTAAFTQNSNADMLLYLLDDYLDKHIKMENRAKIANTFYNSLSGKEAVFALKGYDQFLFKAEENHGSLFLSLLNDLKFSFQNNIVDRSFANINPGGLPRFANTRVHFLLGEVVDGVKEMLDALPKPFFTYLHFMPPHDPYLPTKQYLGLFNDDYAAPAKPRHPMAIGNRIDYPNKRRAYDEFIANVDGEFGQLIDHLQATGMLDNSYVILTSDHGELFERGTRGHGGPFLYEPVVRVPLLISAPGQNKRVDVNALTSNLDLMPTLLQLAGISVPETCQGQVLPGLGGIESADREVWMMEAKNNPTQGPIQKMVLSLILGGYKLIYYYGYKRYPDVYEFYDIKNDPEELENLYPSHSMVLEVKSRLDQKVSEMNGFYFRA